MGDRWRLKSVLMKSPCGCDRCVCVRVCVTGHIYINSVCTVGLIWSCFKPETTVNTLHHNHDVRFLWRELMTWCTYVFLCVLVTLGVSVATQQLGYCWCCDTFYLHQTQIAAPVIWMCHVMIRHHVVIKYRSVIDRSSECWLIAKMMFGLLWSVFKCLLILQGNSKTVTVVSVQVQTGALLFWLLFWKMAACCSLKLNLSICQLQNLWMAMINH